jgi:hypothetical protein
MDGCSDDAVVMGLCSPCYSWLHYWQRKTPAQVLKRVDALEKAERRMATIMPSRVSRMPKKRRASR